MTPFIVGAIGIGVLFILLFSRMPIGIAMVFVGFAGFAYVSGFDASLGMVKLIPFSTFASYSLSVIPLFLLMGSFAFFGGLSKDAYYAVYKWLGHMPGGLAMATVGGCAGFAAVSGTSVATAATMGTVALPEMKKYKYDAGLATGAVAAGGTIGILIPPSTGFILYGIVTEQSIGKLFLSGFIPGVLQAVFYIVLIYFLCKRDSLLGPPGPRTSFTEKIMSLKNTWVVLLLFLLVMGGLYLGIFTPTEAGGIGAFGAFAFAVARRRLSWRAFMSSLGESVVTSAMIFLIVMGTITVGYFLTVTGLTSELVRILRALAVNRYVILAAISVIILFLGCIMDSLAILLLTTPIFYPIIVALGFNPIWFGVIMVRLAEIGMITPPVGMNVFVIQGIARDVPMWTIFRGIMPFVVTDICHLVLLIAIPQISLFLPNMMS